MNKKNKNIISINCIDILKFVQGKVVYQSIYLNKND